MVYIDFYIIGEGVATAYIAFTHGAPLDMWDHGQAQVPCGNPFPLPLAFQAFLWLLCSRIRLGI